MRHRNIFKALTHKRIQGFAGPDYLDPLKHITMKRGYDLDLIDSVEVGEYPMPTRDLKSDYPLKYFNQSKNLLFAYIETQNVTFTLI